MSIQKQLQANRTLAMWIFDTLCNDASLNENDRYRLKTEWCTLAEEHSKLEAQL